jgi:hypothetical protein
LIVRRQHSTVYNLWIQFKSNALCLFVLEEPALCMLPVTLAEFWDLSGLLTPIYHTWFKVQHHQTRALYHSLFPVSHTRVVNGSSVPFIGAYCRCLAHPGSVTHSMVHTTWPRMLQHLGVCKVFQKKGCPRKTSPFTAR